MWKTKPFFNDTFQRELLFSFVRSFGKYHSKLLSLYARAWKFVCVIYVFITYTHMRIHVKCVYAHAHTHISINHTT